jgi:hypothetical protein
MSTQSQDEAFIARVQFALLQEAANTKMEATPPTTISTTADQEDKLARAILANPGFWAKQFAPMVAVQLIAKSSLLDEAVTSDADLFSAVSAVFDKFLPSRA